jgi:hypothetical protein
MLNEEDTKTDTSEQIMYFETLYDCKINKEYHVITVKCNICNHEYNTYNFKYIKSGCRCCDNCHKDHELHKNYKTLCKNNNWLMSNVSYSISNRIYADCNVCKMVIRMKKSNLRLNKTEKYKCLCVCFNELSIYNDTTPYIFYKQYIRDWFIKCNKCEEPKYIPNEKIIKLYYAGFFKTYNLQLLKKYNCNFICKCKI